MPINFYQSSEGLGDLARALVSAPAVYGQAKRRGQQLAFERAQDAAGIQKSMADARKTMLETQGLEDQQRFQAELPTNIDVLDAHQSGRQRRVDPPALGSAGSALEASVNDSIRGNQDLFASTAVPSASDASRARANVIRAYGGNAAQVTDALGNFQSQGLTAEAADAARNSFDDADLSAVLSNIASGSSMTPYTQNASGGVLQQYTGDLNLDNALARASVDSERALAEQRRSREQTLTPQDKQFDALAKLNEAYADAGLPTMDEVTMREIAAGHLQTFNDPLGLTRVIYDPARRQIIGTVDEKNGFKPFQTEAPAPTNDGQSWGQWLRSWLPGMGGGDNGGTQSALPTSQSSQPGVYSPVLDRNVTVAEVEATARNRGLTVAEVRQRLGIE